MNMPAPFGPKLQALKQGLTLVAAVLLASTCRLDRLLVGPQGALLCVTPSMPDTLRDSAANGSTHRPSNPIGINNCGAGELYWTALTKQGSGWLSVQPDSGTVGLSTEPPRVVFDPAALDTGSHYETIVINSAAGSGSVEIPVSFHIYPCRFTPITIDDSATAVLTSADCGAPHRSGSFARLFRFPGTANDSVSFEVQAGFDAYVVLDSNPAQPSIVEADDSALYYQLLPFNTFYYVEVTSAAPADTGAFRLRLKHPRLPRAPQALDQLLGDSITSVDLGASVAQPGILLRAIVSDPDWQDSLHLEAEVRPIGIGFSGPNVPNGPAVANGAPAWVSVSGLSDKTSYHWRVRAGDHTGRSGPWALSGGNPDFVVNVPHAPQAPTTLGQAKGDGTGILTGATTDTDVVILSASVSDQDPGDTLWLDVEVRPVGINFTGATNASFPLRDGGPMQVVVGPLTNSTNYHWRARARDQLGNTSGWVAFGGNLETATDFRIAVPQGPDLPAALQQLQSGDQSPIPVGGAATSNTIFIAAMVSDSDPSQTLRLEVEVEPIETPFTGQPNYVSPAAPNHTTASATIGPLSVNTEYHWQVRARNNATRLSAWVSFPESPGNPETDTDFSFALLPPPVALFFTVQPTTTRAGTVMVPAVEVTALDSVGQRAAGYHGLVTMTLEPNIYGGKLGGTTTVAAVNGVATFADLTVNKAGVGYLLRATTSKPPLATLSAPFDIIRR
jgi:BACON domain-containing protein